MCSEPQERRPAWGSVLTSTETHSALATHPAPICDSDLSDTWHSKMCVPEIVT